MIKNKSKSTIIFYKKIRRLDFLESLIGFIGQEQLQAMIFKTRFGIHTFGLKFPIDILIISDNYRVVKIKENMLPGKVFFWNPKHKIVIELPKGTIKDSKTNVGDQIEAN